MIITCARHTHARGCRDPFWYWDPYQLLVYVAMVVYGGGPLWIWLEVAQKWGLWCFALVVVPFLVPLTQYIFDARAKLPERVELAGGDETTVQLSGRTSQLARVISSARHRQAATVRFRCGPTTVQQASLVAIVVIVLPLLRFLGCPFETLWAMFIAAFGVVAIQMLYFRVRYRIQPGLLTIEHLSGLRVTDRRSVRLAKARVVANLGDGMLHLTAEDGEAYVSTTDLLCPHAFVETLIAAARLPDEENG